MATENSETDNIALVEASKSNIFGKWDLGEVVIEDPSLERYINIKPVAVLHGSARYANKRFGKTRVSIVERLINSIMRTEHHTGKKSKAYRVVREAFEIIHSRMKKNPVQVLVMAIENSAPREEATRLRFGGISVPKAVDTSPSRRLDVALRNISRGSVISSVKNRKSAAECLAGEIMKAAKGDTTSFGVSKRNEMERIAASAR